MTQTRNSQLIRVLLADDHPIIRRGLVSCLSSHPGLAVVGEAANGREAIQKAKELMPDIILMDIDMPQLSGLSALEILRRDTRNIKVIILSGYRHPEYVVRVVQSGARGYVLKDAPPEELIQAIETVHAGQSFYSGDVARIALKRYVHGTSAGSQMGQLSNREQEVLIAITDGLSNKEIGSRLGIGVRTVETHRESIMRRLNIRSVAGLTRFAIANELIVLPKPTSDPVLP